MLYLFRGHFLVTCRQESAVYQNANTYRSFIRRFDEYWWTLTQFKQLHLDVEWGTRSGIFLPKPDVNEFSLWF